jgi:hypothetical protein
MRFADTGQVGQTVLGIKQERSLLVLTWIVDD